MLQKYKIKKVIPFLIGDYWKSGSNLIWSKNLVGLPQFTIKELESFFRDSGKTGKTQKRAGNLLFDNFLDNLHCCQSNVLFYIRGVCSASYRKGQFHKLSCALDIKSAEIKYAYCTCIAGGGGFCNHIYAMLKLIAQFALDKLQEIPEQLPCTSRPCGWTVPQIRKMNIMKPSIMQTTVKKARVDNKTRRGIQCTLYEARSPVVQAYSHETMKTMKEQLQDVNPMIPMVHGLRMALINQEDLTDSQFGKVPIYSPMAYQCSKLGNNFKVYLNIENLQPQNQSNNTDYPDFPHKAIPQYYSYSTSHLSVSERSVIEKLVLSQEEAKILEQATLNQSSCTLWYSQRKQRITASRIHEVYQWKRGLDNHADKFVNPPATNLNPFVQRKFEHGKMYEPVAWEKYKLCMQDKCDVEVLPSGLVINPNNCWLGCSPDAKVLFGDLIGIGESKCPERHKNSDVFDAAKSSDTFLLQLTTDNKLEVRKNHPCYFQIQCQLAITGAKFCDLVVYTFQSIAVVRVTLDTQFWDNVVSKVGAIYFQYILPRLTV